MKCKCRVPEKESLHIRAARWRHNAVAPQNPAVFIRVKKKVQRRQTCTGTTRLCLESSAIEGSEKCWSRGSCRPEMSLYTH